MTEPWFVEHGDPGAPLLPSQFNAAVAAFSLSNEGCQANQAG